MEKGGLMTVAGVPSEGFKAVGDIVATHTLKFDAQADGKSVALDLLMNHIPIGPVVDADGHLEGIVGEREILEALQEGKDLTQVHAKDLVKKEKPVSITDTTSMSDVMRLMQDENMSILPVVHENRVVKSITRHDVIRAMTGAGLGVEKQ